MTYRTGLLWVVLLATASGCDPGPSRMVDVAGPLVIPTEEDWQEHGTVVAPGSPGEWDVRLFGMMSPGSIVRKNGRYLLYYLGADGDRYDGGPANRALGVAISDDGIAFEKHPVNPVLRHQPDGGHGNTVEEGVFSAAATIDPDGDVLMYIGGMESTGPRAVDGDAVFARSADGLSFQVLGDVVSHRDRNVYNFGDEIFPAAAMVGADGRYHLYYVSKGRVGQWTLGVASGDTPDSLGETREALALDDPIHGAGVPVSVPDLGVILPVHVAAETDRIEFVLVDPKRPADLSRRLGSVDFDELGAGPDVDFGTATVLLDLENRRWFLYYIDAERGDVRLRTAAVRFRESS